MKKILTLCLACTLGLACTQGLKPAVKNGQIAPSFNDTLLDSQYLWVRGFGAPNPQHAAGTQRRILSREAAIAHAYQRATEVLYGSDLQSHAQVIDAVSVGSSVDTSSHGVLQHMELVETRYLEDEGCTVVMRLSRQYLQQTGLDLQEKK